MIKKAGIEYTTVTTNIAYGSAEKGNRWELKDCQYEVPVNVAGFVEHLGEERAYKMLRDYHEIRTQDAARRAHVGGKTIAPMADSAIRDVVKDFEFGAKTRIVAVKRPPTKEEALAALTGPNVTKADLEAAIAALRAAASEMGNE